MYAMMALGLTLVYGLLRILHVAHAGVFALGAYAGVLTANATGSLWLAVPAATRCRRRGRPPHLSLRLRADALAPTLRRR